MSGGAAATLGAPGLVGTGPAVKAIFIVRGGT